MRLPGVAPGLPPWRGDILLLNHSRESKRAGKRFCILHLHCSRPMPFQQRTNTSWRSIRSQPAVSRRLFRCLGAHLLRSPCYVNLKFVSLVLMTLSSGRGQTPPVRLLCSSSPNSICRQKTSPGCRFVLVHRLSVFRRYSFTFMVFRENKKPCLHFGKQGGKSSISFVTCLP